MASNTQAQLPPGGEWPEIDMIEGRKWLTNFEKEGVDALPPLSASLEELYADIPTTDGWQSRCKIIRPKTSSSNSENEDRHPLIVYFFGGGYGMGSPEQVTQPARAWAEQHNATVVCPNYRLTPENIWPQGVKDGWDVVSYLSRHAETDDRLGPVKLSDGFVVGGVSAGGGLAGVVGGISVLRESDPDCQLVPQVDKLAKPLTGLFIAVPVFAHEDMIPPAYRHLFTSWEDNSHDPAMNTANIMRTFHLLKCSNYKSPWFSPLNVLERALPGPAGSHTSRLNISRHPSVYIQACGHDPIRDDALVYERMLKDVGIGIRTKLDLFSDDGHSAYTALPGFGSKSKNPTMKEAVMEGMKWLLQAE